MGLLRGAVCHHGGVSENSPSVLMGFPYLVGRSPTLMGRFPECVNGPVSLFNIPWKTGHEEKAHKEVLGGVHWAEQREIGYSGCAGARYHCDT